MQWWIDTVGKLGPLCVAIAVYLANKAQNRRSNAVANRAATVEDQKLRLNLLGLRRDAVDQVRTVTSEFWSSGLVKSEGIEAISEALRTAELVFEKQERDALEVLLGKLLDLKLQKDRQTRFQNTEHDHYVSAIKRGNEIELDLVERLPPLLDRLQRATRIDPPPPLAPVIQRNWLGSMLRKGR